MTLICGSRSASPMAASISSGMGGTMVFSCSGRFSVMVATAPAVRYSNVSKSGMPKCELAPFVRRIGLPVFRARRIDLAADLEVGRDHVGRSDDDGGEDHG